MLLMLAELVSALVVQGSPFEESVVLFKYVFFLKLAVEDWDIGARLESVVPFKYVFFLMLAIEDWDIGARLNCTYINKQCLQ